jgi:Tfp pilus assembly protein PilE
MDIITRAGAELIKQPMKEKSHMILEPLQVIIQLAILSSLPIGTKISITKNILIIQEPSWAQGVLRWYQNDKQDDLYYLFHAIRRYYKWYKMTHDVDMDAKAKKKQENLDYLLRMAIRGLDCLIETYKQSEKPTITHTLSLYRNVLEMDKNELFKTRDGDVKSLDDVFETVKCLYSDELFKIIFNGLKLLESETNHEFKIHYLNGMREILHPLNTNIRNWIQSNLVL